jgi:hypothetical protein
MDPLDALIHAALKDRHPPSLALARIQQQALVEAEADDGAATAGVVDRIMELARADPDVQNELVVRALSVVVTRLLIEQGASYDLETDSWAIPPGFGAQLQETLQTQYGSG